MFICGFMFFFFLALSVVEVLVMLYILAGKYIKPIADHYEISNVLENRAKNDLCYKKTVTLYYVNITT